jgi:predicted alpha/beta superfamily hydrolase
MKLFQIAAWAALMFIVFATNAAAHGQARVDVTFSTTQTTVPGQSIFVLGDLPELGANDLRFAVKLEPSSYPLWKATISLPAGRAYSYRFFRRNDAAGQWGNSGNGTALGSVVNAVTPGAVVSGAKATLYHSGWDAPILWWRAAGSGAAYTPAPMHRVGPGRSAGESRWAARDFGDAGRRIEFYFTNQSQTQRDPVQDGVNNDDQYVSQLDTLFVQDGNVFAYVPPANASGPVKRYTTSGQSPTSTSTGFVSSVMGEWRGYRVITPRGYDQQPTRRYPVLYLHDGQNVFEPGSFGDWLADSTAERLTRLGLVREVILVGMDNTSNRLNDYAAPDSGGWSNGRYLTYVVNELKPLIDAQYRTLAGPQDTGVLGSSMGGQASLWFGWDRPDVFTRLGVFSGAWSVFNSGFYDRVRNQPRREALRIYLDSGDSGTASDLFWTTVNLRDNLINPARAGGVGGAPALEGDLRHTYGPGQIHNEGAWAARLPGCLEFLFPAREAPNELANVPTARPGDVNDDNAVNIDDLYAFEQGAPGARSTLDVNRNGALDSSADRAALLTELRAGETQDATAG